MKKISIVIVNFNRLQYTLDLLRSFTEDYLDSYLDVIVVDNGSNVDCGSILINQFPDITYVRSNKNLGYSGGINLGLSYATGDHILFLENDTVVPRETIDRLSDILSDNPDVGVISPLIYYWDHPELIEYAGCNELDRKTGIAEIVGQMEYWLPEDEVKETCFPHRSAMMVQKDAIALAGLLPENFFFKNYTDMDWGNRIKNAGYKIAVDHGSYIYHKEGLVTEVNSPVVTYFNTRNRILFMRRNATKKHLFVFYNYLLFFHIPTRTLKYAFRKEWSQIKALWAGIRWNLTNAPQSDQLGVIHEFLKEKAKI